MERQNTLPHEVFTVDADGHLVGAEPGGRIPNVPGSSVLSPVPASADAENGDGEPPGDDPGI